MVSDGLLHFADNQRSHTIPIQNNCLPSIQLQGFRGEKYQQQKYLRLARTIIECTRGEKRYKYPSGTCLRVFLFEFFSYCVFDLCVHGIADIFFSLYKWDCSSGLYWGVMVYTVGYLGIGDCLWDNVCDSWEEKERPVADWACQEYGFVYDIKGFHVDFRVLDVLFGVGIGELFGLSGEY